MSVMNQRITRQAMFVLIVILIGFVPIPIEGATFEPFNYQLSGRAMAANDRFIVSIQNRSVPSFHAVQNYSTTRRFCSLTFNATNPRDLYAMMVAVGRDRNGSSNAENFTFIGYSRNRSSLHLVRATINFQHCRMTGNIFNITQNTSYPEYSTLAVSADGDLALYVWNRSIYVHSASRNSNNDRRVYNLSVPITEPFAPISLELTRNWGILTSYWAWTSWGNKPPSLTPTFWILNYAGCNVSWNSSCFRLLRQSTPLSGVGSVSVLPSREDFEEDDYKPLYDISIAINHNDEVLVGIQSFAGVFRFIYDGLFLQLVESRLVRDQSKVVGFGKSVGWLDNNTAAILHNAWDSDYTLWMSSTLELSGRVSGSVLLNSNGPSASFPDDRRKLWSYLDQQLVEMLTDVRSGSLIYMDAAGLVHVFRSSPPGFYLQTNNGIGDGNITIYVAPIVPCPAGTRKTQASSGVDLFLRCDICPEGTYRSATTNTTDCDPCNQMLNFCPHGAVNELPRSILESSPQISTYPQSPENDVFEDILLLNMFSVNFSMDCITKQPVLLALILIGAGCLILIFMAFLKLIGKCRKFRRALKLIFRQTDLIGEGELWIGGVASFTVALMSVFAYRFSSAFINQYPFESAGPSTFACNLELINAKFSTTMQSLITPVPEGIRPLFNMLNEQPFTVNVIFINTALNETHLTVQRVSGGNARNLSSDVTSRDGILFTSTVLPSHDLHLEYRFSENFPIGAVRVGITAPESSEENYKVQQMNFSQVFHYPSRTMTQDAIVTIELMRMVNETQALSNNEDSQYSGIWSSTFLYNFDQMFYTDTLYLQYHTKDETTFTIRLTEPSFFVYNLQEPITRLSELIFTNLLFSTMCIELFALTFLFYKLALHSFIKIIFARCFEKPKPVGKARGGGGGCPYCQPFDTEALPIHQVAVQRSENKLPQYAIQRQLSSTTNQIAFE